MDIFHHIELTYSGSAFGYSFSIYYHEHPRCTQIRMPPVVGVDREFGAFLLNY
jgi:hypothetical protein